MRAGAVQRLLARERQRAVILLLKKRQAKLDAAPIGASSFSAACSSFEDFSGPFARLLLSFHRGARRSAKRFESEPVISRGQSPRQSDIPIIGARLQALDHVAPVVFQYADGFDVAEARKVDDAVLRQREINMRRWLNRAPRIWLQFLRIQ